MVKGSIRKNPVCICNHGHLIKILTLKFEQMKSLIITLAAISVIVCSCQKSFEYEYSVPQRLDKDMTALEFIKNYKGKSWWKPKAAKAAYLDTAIFATYDSLITMTGTQQLFSDPTAVRTFAVWTNKAFDNFYTHKDNYSLKTKKQQWFKLADLPDSVKMAIVKFHTIDGVKITYANVNNINVPLNYRKNFKTMMDVNVTLWVNDAGQILSTGDGMWSVARNSNYEPRNGALHVVDNAWFNGYSKFFTGSTYQEPIQ